MGIITNPGYELYGTQNDCWETGLTPKKLYACFSGVETDYNWTPAIGNPRNGEHILEQSSYKEWRKDVPEEYSIILTLEKTASHLEFWYYYLKRFFEGYEESDCVFDFTANIPGSQHYFKNGFEATVERENTDVLTSLKKTCELTGVPEDLKTFAEITLDDTGKKIIRLARQSDGTCIRVKYQS